MTVRIVILAPWCGSGGPEALHQLCHAANFMGAHASILYDDAPHDRLETFFEDAYPLARRAVRADGLDGPDTILVVPETYRLDSGWSALFPRAKKVVWWLSLDLGLPHLDHFLVHDAMQPLHIACQSDYALHGVSPSFPDAFKLTDYVRVIKPDWNDASPIFDKRDVVMYHLRKDWTTPDFCWKEGIEAVPIHGVSAEESQKMLATAKVYCDFGSHPGRDRMPREAAMQGCVVITGRKGSAAFDGDVPLGEFKCDSPERAAHLVKEAFENYDEVYASQKPYRDWILDQKSIFENEVKQLFKL
jgi:hypothetical protein